MVLLAHIDTVILNFLRLFFLFGHFRMIFDEVGVRKHVNNPLVPHKHGINPKSNRQFLQKRVFEMFEFFVGGDDLRELLPIILIKLRATHLITNKLIFWFFVAHFFAVLEPALPVPILLIPLPLLIPLILPHLISAAASIAFFILLVAFPEVGLSTPILRMTTARTSCFSFHVYRVLKILSFLKIIVKNTPNK